LNGNVIYSPTGAIIRESALELAVVKEVYNACRDAGISLFLYDRERNYHVLPFRTVTTEAGDRLLRAYGEDVVDLAQAQGVMEKVWAGELTIIKMAICEVEEHIPSTSPPSLRVTF
jgi:hydroxymethylpyrimidine pyrophosphatase-like HAD family hydrolase